MGKTPTRTQGPTPGFTPIHVELIRGPELTFRWNQNASAISKEASRRQDFSLQLLTVNPHVHLMALPKTLQPTLTPDELTFLAEDEQIDIVPLFSMTRIRLLSAI